MVMNADIFILARLDSSRLPKKHLEKIQGIPVIKHLFNRLKKASKIRNIVVCTTNLASDDQLVEYLEKEKIKFFRGEEKDILKRLLDAANYFKTDLIVDVEGDKLYTDPKFVDKIVEDMEKSDLDFVIGNDSLDHFNPHNHFVHGIIPAGIRVSALETVCKLKTTNNTETGYKEFFTNNEKLKIKYLLLDEKLKIFSNIRLTLDYSEDLQLAKEIFQVLGTDFNHLDILKLFQNKPDLLSITESILKKWDENYQERVTDYSLKSGDNS